MDAINKVPQEIQTPAVLKENVLVEKNTLVANVVIVQLGITKAVKFASVG